GQSGRREARGRAHRRRRGVQGRLAGARFGRPAGQRDERARVPAREGSGSPGAWHRSPARERRGRVPARDRRGAGQWRPALPRCGWIGGGVVSEKTGTIHDIGYKRYVGTRRSVATRWRVIMRNQVAMGWKKWWRYKMPLFGAVIALFIA